MNYLDNIVEKLNKGYDLETENFLRREFFNVLQVSLIIPYLRGRRWVVLYAVQLSLFLFLMLSTMILFFYTGFLLKDYEVSLMAQAFHYGAGEILALSIALSVIWNRFYFAEIFKYISTNFYDYGDLPLPNQIKEKRITELFDFKRKMFKTLPSYFFVIGLIALLIGPMLDRMQGSVFEESYVNDVYMDSLTPFWFPFIITNNTRKFIIVCYFILTASILLLTILSGILIIIFMAHSINVQLLILIDSIKNLEKRALENCMIKHGVHLRENNKQTLYKNVLFHKEYEYCLKQNVEHQMIIIRCSYVLDILLRWPMFAAVFVLSIVIACALFTVLKGNQLLGPQVVSALLLFVEAVCIALICWRGQEMIDLSDDVSTALYELKWLYCPSNINRMILIMKERSKKPLQMKAGGLTTVNWELFSRILNSSYTYFNLMYAMK